MATRITFLGTAGENAVASRYDRNSGGIIIEVDDRFFFLDPGPGALVQAGKLKFNLREFMAIVLSSPRLEQSNDINAIIDAMTAKGLDKHGVLLCNTGEKEMPLLEKYKQWVERIIHLEPGKKIAIEDIDMVALPAKESNAQGISFFTKDGVITYTSNTSYDEAIVEHYKGSHVLILNVFHPRGITESGFLNTDNAIAIVKVVKPKVALITHFGIKMIKAEPLYEAREIQRQTGVQVIAAKECLTLSLTPFASDIIVR